MDHLHPAMQAALAPFTQHLPRSDMSASTDKTVTLREGEQYGAKVYKPGCEASAIFAQIARTETITPATIMRMKQLGYTVKVQGKPEVTL